MPNFEKYNLSQVKLKGFINYLNIYSKMYILKNVGGSQNYVCVIKRSL